MIRKRWRAFYRGTGILSFPLILACLAVVLFVSPSASANGNSNCSRFDPFSLKEISKSGNPFALACALDAKTPTAQRRLAAYDNYHIGLYRIQLLYAFGEDEAVIEATNDWLNKYATEITQDVVDVMVKKNHAHMRLGQVSEALDILEQIIENADSRLAHSSRRYLETEYTILSAESIRIRASDVVPIRIDSKGRTEIPVLISGENVDMVFDTGAGRSSIHDGDARRLGFEILPNSESEIRTFSGTRIKGKLALAPPLAIGDIIIENLIFFVFPEEYDAPLYTTIILGFNALEAIGRVAWLDNGKKLALGKSAPAPKCFDRKEKIFRHEGGIGLSVEFDSGVAPAHFDTGLQGQAIGFSRPLSFYAPEIRQPKKLFPVRVLDTFELVKLARSASFKMDNEDVTVYKMPIFRSGKNSTPLDLPITLGGLMVRKLEVLTLDFDSMTYAARRQRDELTARCLQLGND